jgi:hypothetical protein
MPDPQPGDGGIIRFEAAPGDGSRPDESKFMEADKACRHLMEDAGPASLSPAEQEDTQDAMLAFARCMRDHGIDMPDPEPGGTGIRTKAGAGADPESPEFGAAEKRCQKHTAEIDKKLGVSRSHP